jgi:RNA polymerase sigma-70 factor (ECF subfamily)
MDDTRQWIEVLYREAGPQLLFYLMQRLGDNATAEDILQDTFAAALRHPERVRSASSARAYLFGIARNLAATASRRVIQQVAPLSLTLAADESPRDPRLELLRDAIERLKPEFKEALEMRLQHELSYEEMADVLGVPIGTVRSRLHYAVNQLRRLLRQAEPISMVRKEEV